MTETLKILNWLQVTACSRHHATEFDQANLLAML